MKELLIDNGWVYHKTGCACNGSPVIYRHPSYINYEVILRSRQNKFSIKQGSTIIASGQSNQLLQKLKENELLQEDKSEDQNMETQQERS